MPPATNTPAVLSSNSPEAVLPVPGKVGRLIIDIRQVENPGRAPVTITAVDNGSPPSVEKFSLYPPDQPARFAFRVSPGATQLQLSLAPSNVPGSPQVVIRAVAAPANRD